jgi:predicted membrane protein
MAEDRRSIITPRLVVGISIASLGVLFTLNNLGVVEARQYVRFWPAVLLLIGALKFAQARSASAHVAGAVWMTVGGWFLLDNLGLIRYRVWDLWPLILVGIGVYLVVQTLQGTTRGQVASDPDPNASVSAVAIMGGLERASNAKNFKGGDLTAIMGGSTLDLRRATMATGGAVIDVFALWGGIEIKVPDDWTVVPQVFPLMGGFEDRTQPPKGGSTQQLTIRGMVVMGGVEVSN